MPGFVLALDQGTTSSRSILFDEGGRAVASAQKDFAQIYPHPGWVEHDPEIIWSSQLETARQVLAQAGVRPQEVAAVGITNQRETTVLWDRATGKPIHNAIVWQCRRTASMCQQLKARGLEDEVRRRTGLVIDAYFSGTKVAWLLDHVDGARRLAEDRRLAFGTIDSFLLWRLTDGAIHATDVSNASRTMLFNLSTLTWDPFLLQELRIPEGILPQVVSSSQMLGETTAEALGGRIPIAGIAGDQQAALFGQSCFQPGMAKNTYGTGCFLLLHTGMQPVPSTSGLLTTAAWQLRDRSTGSPEAAAFALEGSIFIAGAAVQWLRDGLRIIRESSEVESLAASVPDSGGVVFVPALVGLGAPYWDPYARGTIVGLTRGSTRAHLARATLEAIAFQTRDVLEAMQRDAGLALHALRVDGGAARNDLLLQLQADLLGTPVQRPTQSETTALGAAMLAGLSAGVWSSVADLERVWTLDREFVPAMSQDERDQRYIRWQEAVRRARDWAAPEANA
ncbi:MAG TPA: glycerol kinase GlpK [Anaerolineales bacterium]|nr:glycerol kinase GlpK [Anaerolineales bacterium]